MNLKNLRNKYQSFLQDQKPFNPGASSWYRMDAEGDSAEIFLYDGIGLFGVEPEQFISSLNSLDAKEITLRINSPGGNVFDGTTIYNALLRHRAKIHTKIDGIAASMASVIALAGDTIEIAENAFFMIHKPWSVVVGDADDMRKEVEILDKLEDSAVGVYDRNSDLSADEIRAAMKEETWYSASEAKDAGFVDTIYVGDDEEMSARLMLFGSDEKEYEPTERGLESMARDAGMSRRQAKDFVSSLKLDLRDAGSGAQRDAEMQAVLNGLNAGIQQHSTY